MPGQGRVLMQRCDPMAWQSKVCSNYRIKGDRHG